MKAFLMVLGSVCLLLALVGLTELDILPSKLIAPEFLLGVAFCLGIKFLGIRTEDGDGGTGHNWSDCGGWEDGGDDGDGGGD